MILKRRFSFVVGVMVIMVSCFCCSFIQVWIGMGAKHWQRQQAMKLATQKCPPGRPLLGVVLPLNAEDMAGTMESLQHWPTKCSETTLNRLDLILYFAKELPPELDLQLEKVTASTSCFKTTKVVSAGLHHEEISDQDIRSAQFYKMFLVPDVRVYFVQYDAIAILNWHRDIVQERSFERLYSTAFLASGPFWVKRNRHIGKFSDDGATPATLSRIDHLDNAIYNNTDSDFFNFVNFTLERWHFTLPYNAALWTTISDYAYSWPLWQWYASKFVETCLVCNSGYEAAPYGLQCIRPGLRKKCPFCFHYAPTERIASNANEAGERVVLCKTRETFSGEPDMARIEGISTRFEHEVTVEKVKSTPVDNAHLEEPPSVKPAGAPFIGDIMHGNICHFIPGYFEFFHETRLAVATILTFMPGVRVVVATHPMDYHVFYRALGEPNAAVTIVNDTRVAFASLSADDACGNGTRYIYYMNPGEVLSRSFTAWDTHSTKGKLLVKYTDAKFAGGEYTRRSLGSEILLGLRGLSFTYDSDLILPVEINSQLRSILKIAMDEYGLNRTLEDNRKDVGTQAFHQFLDSISSIHIENASIFIPELLAATQYKINHEGVHFFDTEDRRYRYSPETSKRDALLVKSRFGCLIDLSLSLQGYDIAHQLEKHVQAFYNGTRCYNGVMEVDSATLKLKSEWEFPSGYPISSMPSLKDYRISIVYRTFFGDAELFNVSFQTAIAHIPNALEMVVVVEERDKELFDELLDPHRGSAPFSLRVETEPTIMNGHIQQKYSKMRADLYTKGDYILHLDSDVLVLRDVTYDDIFHLGKPVLPFRRYRDESPEGLALIQCWQNGTSLAIGEEVLHEFSIFNTHVYPRQMYKALREFVEKKHRKSFSDFMSTRVGKCSSTIDLATWTADKRDSLLSDFNLMGAYLWYHMPQVVYWMAADPYDLRPDQWRIDLSRYEWICQANGRSLPKDAAGKDQFKADFLSVTNSQGCNYVYQQWMDPKMKNPKTRTKVI